MKDYGTLIQIAKNEIKALELERDTIPFTLKDKAAIQELVGFNNDIIRVLGAERDETAGRGWGATVFKTVTDLQSRIEALESKATV